MIAIPHPPVPRLTAGAAVLFLTLAGCGDGDARRSDRWAWRQGMEPGEWLRVRNMNGPIRVARASGGEVQVSARKRYQGRRPEAVRFVVAREGGGAVVCAVWGSSGGECERDAYRGGRRGLSWWDRIVRRRANVSVDFVVALPAGVRLDASTLNGSVTVADAAGEVRARTVNGAVTVDARRGPVRAETVNGGVTAQIHELAPGAGVELESVNGSVTAILPPSVDGELDLRTTNGRVSTAFPVAVEGAGRADRRRLAGTLGAGGRPLSLKTVNGSVRVERAVPAAGAGTM